MKKLSDYEKQLKERAFKSHDLALEADCVSIETALLLIQEAASQAIDRCASKVDVCSTVETEATKQSILKIKDELK